MKMVDQTRFELPDGNCGAACLATIFGVDIDEAPNMNVEGWEHSVSKWTRQFGYWVLNCTFLVGEYPQGIALAGVPSRRLNGKQHCVIFEDGRLLHDPNPDRERWDPYTVDDVLEWTLFVAFDPTDGKPSSDPRDAVVAALEAENAALRATTGSWINKQMTEADRAKQRDWQAHDETAICGVCEAPLLVHYEVSPDPGRWTQTYKRTEQAVVAAAQILVKARHWEMMTSRLDPNVAALMAALEGLDG